MTTWSDRIILNPCLFNDAIHALLSIRSGHFVYVPISLFDVQEDEGGLILGDVIDQPERLVLARLIEVYDNLEILNQNETVRLDSFGSVSVELQLIKYNTDEYIHVQSSEFIPETTRALVEFISNIEERGSFYADDNNEFVFEFVDRADVEAIVLLLTDVRVNIQNILDGVILPE